MPTVHSLVVPVDFEYRAEKDACRTCDLFRCQSSTKPGVSSVMYVVRAEVAHSSASFAGTQISLSLLCQSQESEIKGLVFKKTELFVRSGQVSGLLPQFLRSRTNFFFALTMTSNVFV